MTKEFNEVDIEVPQTELKLLSVEDKFYGLVAPLSARASWDERANQRHKQIMTEYQGLKSDYTERLIKLIVKYQEKR